MEINYESVVSQISDIVAPIDGKIVARVKRIARMNSYYQGIITNLRRLNEHTDRDYAVTKCKELMSSLETKMKQEDAILDKSEKDWKD